MPRTVAAARSSWWRRLLRRHDRITWVVVAVHLLLALSFSVLLPAFRGPDEAMHIDMVRQYRQELGHDEPDQLVPVGAGIVEALRTTTPDVRPRPPMLAEDATPRRERPSFSELAEQPSSGRQNHMTQHPPLFYAAVSSGSAFLAGLTPSDWWSWDREVLLYRWLSILLNAPLPLLAAEAALAIGLSRRAGALAAAALLLVPQASFISAAVNNDAVVALGAAGAVAASLWHLRSGTARTAVLAALAACAAALSKATAAPLLVWVLVVIAVRWVQTRRDGGAQPSRSGLVTAIAVTGVGFSWYLTNLVRYRDPQPTGLRPHPELVGFRPSPFGFLHQWLDRLSLTFWGMPGRRTGVTLPWAVPHLLSTTALVLAIASFWDTRRRRATLLLWLLCGAQIALLLRTNWAAHARTGGLPAIQGRYLFALLVPGAVLAVVGARQLEIRWPPNLPRPTTGTAAVGVVALGTLLHLLLGISMLEGYWAAPDASMWQRVVAVRAWSALPGPLTVALVVSLPVATLAAVTWFLVAVSGEVRAVRGRGRRSDQDVSTGAPGA